MDKYLTDLSRTREGGLGGLQNRGGHCHGAGSEARSIETCSVPSAAPKRPCFAVLPHRRRNINSPGPKGRGSRAAQPMKRAMDKAAGHPLELDGMLPCHLGRSVWGPPIWPRARRSAVPPLSGARAGGCQMPAKGEQVEAGAPRQRGTEAERRSEWAVEDGVPVLYLLCPGGYTPQDAAAKLAMRRLKPRRLPKARGGGGVAEDEAKPGHHVRLVVACLGPREGGR